MLKHQIIIGLAVIALAIWIAYRIREGRKNDEDDDSEATS